MKRIKSILPTFHTYFLLAVSFVLLLHSPGAQAGYIDNLDGTITDTGTGLMWQKAPPVGATYAWDAALSYCENLILNNDGLWTSVTANASGAKYSDWRLPTAKELESIVDTTTYDPTINITYFPGTVATNYWSSTTVQNSPDCAWFVSFYNGAVRFADYSKSSNFYVRAVRSGQAGAFDYLHVPDTGQTTCYNATVAITCPAIGQPYYGQDATYSINTPAYTKLAAGGSALPVSALTWAMVRDDVTCLVWEEKHFKDSVTNYSVPNDADNTYTWYDGLKTTTTTSVIGTDTQDFINAMNTAKYGGYSDWRLPTDKELQTIVDYGRDNKTINTIYFPNTVASGYWSSTTNADPAYPDWPWHVDFSNGSVDFSYPGNPSYVRAVRTGQCLSSTTTTTGFYADFTAAPVLGPAPLEVQFSDASSPGASGHTWDFGDGTGGTEINPTHEYKASGVYTVSLTVSGPNSAAVRNAKVAYIKVIATAPFADFKASVTEGPTPLTVLFTDTSTGTVTGREWNFGDGETGDQARMRHTFDAAGSYTVSLKVMGPDGTSIKTREAFITAKPGLRTSAVSGQVTGDAQAGIAINLSSRNLSRTVQTDTHGSYSFGGVLNGQYRITPIKPGYAFDPTGTQLRVFGRDQTGIDFRAALSGPNIEQVYTTPESASADGLTKFSLFARVTHPDGLGAIASVTADLTAIGSPAEVELGDEGKAGDAAAGDGLYTLAAAVLSDTEPGLKPLQVRARDGADIARTAVVTLPVYKKFIDTVIRGAPKEYQISNSVAGQTVVFTLKLDGGGAGGSPPRMSRDASSSSCTPTVEVRSPGGTTYTGQTGAQNSSTGQTSVEVPNAEAGTWTCKVVNDACTAAVSYGLESTIAGTGVVFGVVVDSRNGQGLGGISLQTTGGISAQTNEGAYVMLHPSGMFSLSCSGAGFVSATRSLTVNSGSTTELNIALDNSSLTGSCFLKKSLGEDSLQLAMLQRFRDLVLGKSAQGKQYVRLYYRYSPEIRAMMQKDVELAGDINQCAVSLMPLVEKMLQGGEAMPDGQQRSLLTGCLEKIRARAQPGLRAETERVLKILEKNQPLNSMLR